MTSKQNRATWRKSLPKKIQKKLKAMDHYMGFYHDFTLSLRLRGIAMKRLDELAGEVKSYAGF